jgi:ATP-dependent exoDNAse (exonuclease V) beta subunit
VQTVREWIATDESATFSGLAVEPSAVTIVSSGVGSDDSRPRGAAFGSLVHAVLARVPFGATPQALATIAEVEARLLGASDEDASAAVMVVERVLAHALWKRARAAEARGACRREAPITFVLSEGTLLEGVVDLAYEEDGCWTVVDYKTDYELAAGEERYRRQVALYASAIAQTTSAPCKGVLMII